MIFEVDVDLHYRVAGPTDLLMQIEIADAPDQRILASDLTLRQPGGFARVPAQESIGDRIWMRVETELECRYHARVEVIRLPTDLARLKTVAPMQLPAEAVRYLLPSRYCPSDEFQTFASDAFGHLEGGARIAGIRDWIAGKVSYVIGSSGPQTTAQDTFVQRQGVCRDFAHLLITLARASGVPARFASVYAPQVSPPDFHAVAEVFLSGGWHLVDATGMAPTEAIARIGVGLDAAEVAFLSSFGQMELCRQSVQVGPDPDCGP